MRRRGDMNATIEETDGLKREPMRMGAHVGGSPVKHYAEGFERLDSDRTRDLGTRLAQKFEDVPRIVAGKLVQACIDLNPKMFVSNEFQAQGTLELFGIRKPPFIFDGLQAKDGVATQGLELRTGRIEKCLQMQFCGRKTPSRARQRG